MPQDRDTGAEAAAYGLRMAGIIGQELGATRLDPDANEFTVDGRLITIRCAHMNTASVGVLDDMLSRVQAVWGAFQEQDGSYIIHELLPPDFRRMSRRAVNNDRVCLVTRSAFKTHGRKIKRVFVRDPLDD